MRLKITHTTRYEFDEPVHYGLQQIRKTPKATRSQTVLNWTTTLIGARKEVEYDDQHRNRVELISFEPGTRIVEIRSEGEAEQSDTQGIVGPHAGHTPLWLFQKESARTKAGKACRALARDIAQVGDIERMHLLSEEIRKRVTYEIGGSSAEWTAEEALVAGRGVCQDHTHIFLTCARLMGYPARYVSGYLMMDDRTVQDATHAWAEAHLEGLGWVGFDISNGISPDTRYVRVATGLDYGEAAPVTGTHFGRAGDSLSVEVEVAQQ